MNLCKALIIDDEPKVRQVLLHKLKQLCPEVEVPGTAADVDEAYRLIQTHHPQMVFLDVSMPSGTGFDLLHRFVHIDFEVIFITGSDNHVLDALKISAVDYLLKPVISEELVLAVAKALERISHRQQVKQYEVLQHKLDHLEETNSKIAIPGMGHYDFVRIKDIIRCEGWDGCTRIFLANGKCIVSSYHIGSYKERLATYGFICLHKSHLIHPNWIASYRKEGVLVLEDGSEVPVSRRKKREFETWMMKRGLIG